jgi:tetratricopeptide (TPR) repeat protein
MILRFSLLIALAAYCFAAKRAILIGVNDYTKDERVRPLRWAEQDRIAVERQAPAKSFSAISVIPSARGQLDKMHSEFDRIVMGASEDDIVYVFISSRGMARPGASDGYILGSDSLSSRPEDTGFRISRLQQMILASAAKKFVILADLCRLPSQPDRANHINRVLSDLGKVKDKRKVIEGILATETGQYSDEDGNLAFAGNNGFGIFSYHVAVVLAGGKARTTEQLYRSIRSATIPRKQKPILFGPPSGAGTLELWAAVRHGDPNLIQIAALPWFRLMLPAPQAELPFQTNAPIRSVLDELGISGPADAVAKIQSRSGAIGADRFNQLIALAVPEMASRGQAIIVRYGSADMLPDDPLRVNEREFREAAGWFSAALRLRPLRNGFDSFRESLAAREKFCSAMADKTDGKTLEAVATMPGHPESETQNALGVYYLEQERDYSLAEQHFKKARALAPGWAYPRHNLALTYVEQGNYSAAEREMRSAIDAEPDQPYLYYNLGLLQQRLNRRREAMKNYNTASTKYLTKSVLLKKRAEEWKRNFPDDAIMALARADILDRNRAEVWNAKGTLLQVEDHEPEAAQQFAAAYKANDTLCAARYNHAILIEKADASQAAALHATNFAKCPEFHPSRLKLGDAELRAGHIATAESHFCYVRDTVKGNTEARRGLARVHAARRQFGQAIAELEKVIRIQTSGDARRMAMPAVYEELAHVQESAGQAACGTFIKAADALRYGEYTGDAAALRERARRCRSQSK